MAADPFDEFEFKPLTEGLGFHKEAEKIKADIKASRFVQDKVSRSIPEPPRNLQRDFGREFGRDSSRDLGRHGARETSQNSSHGTSDDSSYDLTHDRERTVGYDSKSATTDLLEGLPTNASGHRAASQSISDLIASLPPSLDFVEDEPASVSDRPQIFQPLGREDYTGNHRVDPGLLHATESHGGGQGTSLAQKPGSLSSVLVSPPGPSTLGSGAKIGAFLPPPGSKAGSPFNLSLNHNSPSTFTSPSANQPSLGTNVGGSTLGGQPASPGAAAPLTSAYRERLEKSFARAFPHAEKAKIEDVAHNTELQAVPAHMGSAILDAMVAAGITTILLVAILAITRINLLGMLSHPATSLRTELTLGLLFVAVIEMYMLTARSVFTASLGEWAFDLQLGSYESQKNPYYPVRVAWRLVVLTFSGFVVLPLLSFLFRRDLLSYVTGLRIYRRL